MIHIRMCGFLFIQFIKYIYIYIYIYVLLYCILLNAGNHGNARQTNVGDAQGKEARKETSW